MRICLGLAALALLLAPAGCGGDGEGDDRVTGFERALAELGEGVSGTGSGFGWADLEQLDEEPGGTRWAADALGPGADDLIDDQGAIFRGTGFAPSAASGAVAVAGSYALGVRFDGADAGGLRRLLPAAGARSRRIGEWTLYDLGRPAYGETSGPLAPLGALVSRIAIGPAGVVLSRFGPARSSLIGEKGGPLELGEAQTLGADCLGEVTAARLIKGFHTHNPAASPAMIAIGVRRDGDSWREVLCTVDDSPDAGEERAAAIERTLAPAATDEITGDPISGTLAEVSVSRESTDEWEVSRAELELAPGVDPGFLFGAFTRGSLLTYLGAARPIPR